MNNGDMPAMPPNAGWEHPQAKGLTKREYFAGLAMQAILSNPDLSGHVSQKASSAVSAADALLKELDK